MMANCAALQKSPIEKPPEGGSQFKPDLVDVRRWLDPRWRFTHMPSGEYRDSVTASRLSQLGVVAGWPDLQFAGPDRKMVFLELKSRRGRLSLAQAAMREI
jgi:hypothetical protein